MNKKLIGLAVIIGLVIAGVYSFAFPQTAGVGTDLVAPIAGQAYTLAGSGMSSSATTFTLSSLTLTQNGHPIQDNEVSDTFYLTIEPGSRSRQEIISCTTIGTNTGGNVSISGCVRGLSPITPYTASTSLAFSHSGGSTVIFSDAPQLFNQAAFKDNDAIITGVWTGPTPTNNDQLATKAYVDALASGTTTVSNDRLIVAGTAGVTVATGTLVYFEGTSQTWKKVNAASSTTYNDKFLGLTQSAADTNTNITRGILLRGRDTTQTGMTPGALYYAATGTATGTLTTNASSSQTVGIAVSATVLYFDPIMVDVPTQNGDNVFTGTNNFIGNTIGFGTSSTTYFTTVGTSTYTKASKLKYIVVEVCGSGGGGGSGNSSGNGGTGGGGGGSGGYGRSTILNSNLNSTTTIFVGSNNNGSYFTGVGTTTGGSSASVNVGGAGGTAAGFQFNLSGQTGVSLDKAADAQHGYGGFGGSSILGFGGAGAAGYSGATGQNGIGYCSGGGGGGGWDTTSGGGNIGLGGNGANGIIIVTEFF